MGVNPQSHRSIANRTIKNHRPSLKRSRGERNSSSSAAPPVARQQQGARRRIFCFRFYSKVTETALERLEVPTPPMVSRCQSWKW